MRDGEKVEIGTIFEHSVILARLDACSTDLYGLSNLNSILVIFNLYTIMLPYHRPSHK